MELKSVAYFLSFDIFFILLKLTAVYNAFFPLDQFSKILLYLISIFLLFNSMQSYTS